MSAIRQRWIIALAVMCLGAAPVRFAPHPAAAPTPTGYRVASVRFAGAGGTLLAGTLTRPSGPGPFPAVVLIAGSGPMDRDETVAGHPIFGVLADALTRAGIAVLRYDKRGVGSSGGVYVTTSLAVFAEDAQDAFSFLRAQRGVGTVGLLGHSEGGLIAPVVAAHDPRVAFLVLLAPPALPGLQIVMAQQQALLRASGAPPAEIARKAALERQILTVAQDPDPDHARAAVIKLLVSLGMDAAHAAAQAQVVTSAPYRSFLAADPAPGLRALRIPVLAVQGGRDVQVPPEVNLPALRAELAQDHEARIVVLDRLNHLLEPAVTGLPSEYAASAVVIAPAALQVVTGWIRRQPSQGHGPPPG